MYSCHEELAARKMLNTSTGTDAAFPEWELLELPSNRRALLSLKKNSSSKVILH